MNKAIIIDFIIWVLLIHNVDKCFTGRFGFVKTSV